MAISPLEPHDKRDFLRPGRMADSLLLAARIDRLLHLLERQDIPPPQRVRLLNALNAMQQQLTLLKALSGNNESATPAQTKRGLSAVVGEMTPQQPGARVSLGETGKVLSQLGDVERALEAKSGLERTLRVLDRAAPDVKADAMRIAAENYLVVAAQVPPPDGNDAQVQAPRAVDPHPVFGLIPPQWLPQGLRSGKRRSAGDFSLLVITIVLIMLALFFI